MSLSLMFALTLAVEIVTFALEEFEIVASSVSTASSKASLITATVLVPVELPLATLIVVAPKV